MDQVFADVFEDLGYSGTRVFDQVSTKVEGEPFILNC